MKNLQIMDSLVCPVVVVLMKLFLSLALPPFYNFMILNIISTLIHLFSLVLDLI